MNKAMLLVGIILLGVATLWIINVVQGYSTGSELDYYLLKETTDAAMTDAIDTGYYADAGVARIDKEKFVESFVRRFSDSVDQSRSYRIRIYDINETPPKVSIRIDSSTSSSFKAENVQITTNIDAVLESINTTDVVVTNGIKDPNILLGKVTSEQ